jgi:DHA1 family multidrug resistance protein-like MFS transporter
MPYLIRGFVTGEDVERATNEAFSIAVSLGYAATTVGYLLGGFTADVVGRRKIVISSFAMLATGFALFAAAPNMYVLFVARFIQMLGMGFSAPALSALVADYSAQSSRGMAYGVYNLSWITAQIPAPLLGGVIAQYVNVRTPFIIAIFISIVGLLFSILMQGNHAEKRRLADKEKDTAVEESASTPTMPLRRVLFIFSLTNIMNGLLNGFLSPLFNYLLQFKLSATPTEYGLVSSLASGLVTAIVQVPGGKLTDKFGRKPLILLAFLGAPLVFALSFSQSIWEFIVIMGAVSAVGNMSSPATAAWLMDFVPQRKRASVLGITRTVNGVGLSVGPNVGFYVLSSTPSVAIPFGTASLLYAIGLSFYLILKEPRKTAPQTVKTS